MSVSIHQLDNAAHLYYSLFLVGESAIVKIGDSCNIANVTLEQVSY